MHLLILFKTDTQSKRQRAREPTPHSKWFGWKRLLSASEENGLKSKQRNNISRDWNEWERSEENTGNYCPSVWVFIIAENERNSLEKNKKNENMCDRL